MKLYISGPISGVPDHLDVFISWAGFLADRGHEPCIPQNIPHPGECPPGARNSEGDPHTWACYLRKDLLFMLEQTEGLVMLPGWDCSAGAMLEHNVARSCGMPVWYAASQGDALRTVRDSNGIHLKDSDCRP